MSSERLQVSNHILKDTLVFGEYPIHFAGATFFIRNDNDVPVTLQLHESDDGSTWNLMTFSSAALSGLTAVTVQEQAFAVITFTTPLEYMRVSVSAPTSPAKSVYLYLAQYPPKAREQAAEY